VRLSRFFVAAALAPEQELRLPEAAAAHAVRVLRLAAGDALTIFNGQGGEYAARILASGRDGVRIRVEAWHDVERESPLQITLLQGISRGERMDIIVQKATELGVARIVPLQCERSVVKLDADQAGKKREHWLAIAIGACEQSGRNQLPAIAAVRRLDAACQEVAQSGMARFTLDLAGEHSLLTAAGLAGLGVSQPAPGASLRQAALLIGPEGGLSEAEIATAQHHGFLGVRLGPRVLRTETAPLAALAVLQAAAGDLGT
jgi:16S rRNA (uracil1498-N3)-methyltransferase